MLIFDKDVLQFQYIEKSHLKSTITLTNNNDQFAYYKFKITQPKYYLIKQDKGLIKPKQAVTIDVMLHKDGVATSGYDKIKCLYTFHDVPITQQPENFERRSDTRTHKLTIKVNGLPLGFQKIPTDMKSSQVKSVLRSQSQFGKTSKTFDSLTLQRQIEQKQEEIIKIKNQMSTIRSTMQKTQVTEKDQPLSALVIWAALGLLVGGLVGFYFY